MADDACPGCGANLKIETRGDLHDKLQVCPHCGFERDVLDEVTIHKKEAGKEVTIHRRDLGGEAPSEREPRDPEAIDAQVRELMGDEVADLVKEALSGPQAGGKVVTHTSTTVSTSTTDGEVVSGAAAAELLAQHGISIRGLGGDPIESQTYSGEQAEAKLADLGLELDLLEPVKSPVASAPEKKSMGCVWMVVAAMAVLAVSCLLALIVILVGFDALANAFFY